MLPLNLVYFRHGQSERNLAGKKAYEENDDTLFEQIINKPSALAPLTPLGIEQARKSSDWVANMGITFGRHYVSSHVRAMETAGHLNLPNAIWYINNNLRERSGGVMEDMSPIKRREYLSSLRSRGHLLDLFNFRPDRGESYADIADLRWPHFLGTLHRECWHMDGVFVVCHGDIMWAARSIHERWTPRDFDDKRGAEAHSKIPNCMVLHYTRVNPDTREVAPYLGWYRTCCPWQDLTPSAWEKIEYKRYSSEELLAQVEASKERVRLVS